ncbi:DUF881 domain-containing protein [Alloscardovia macacae]|uniref:DUF881 domain-containing protein n=1 Tax=Alloscardovia macacae TaxID=1160091 RepID=A0A261F6J0_9BIFI|nr:DUF881 domain-containing protein [Alloscardovia macacae]OZG54698.1 hypothetical protein ALMA_0023 [Alloscardovia macacae]
MKKRARHSKHGSLLGAVAIFLSFAIVGWIAVTNVKNPGTTYHADTAEIIAGRQKRIDELQKDIDDKTQKIDTLQKVVADTSTNDPSTSADDASGKLPALEGPGVTVTLSDSQKWEQAVKTQNANPNDYVVHQQDIEAVVNAMWAGGAEAITIQDQRLLPTSAIKCIGNVLLLNGKQYAPPYRISAIGDIDSLTSSINTSETVRIYKQYVDADGLGWQLDTSKTLTFKETSAPLQAMKYATADRTSDSANTRSH